MIVAIVDQHDDPYVRNMDLLGLGSPGCAGAGRDGIRRHRAGMVGNSSAGGKKGWCDKKREKRFM